MAIHPDEFAGPRIILVGDDSILILILVEEGMFSRGLVRGGDMKWYGSSRNVR
jgi:hypothetical protein